MKNTNVVSKRTTLSKKVADFIEQLIVQGYYKNFSDFLLDTWYQNSEVEIENFRTNICRKEGCNRHLGRTNTSGYCCKHWQQEMKKQEKEHRVS